MHPQQQMSFTGAIKEYSLLALQLWPALKLAMINLPQVIQPPEDSMVPSLNYSIMDSKEFINAIAEGLSHYVQNYDVQEEDLEDYMEDILFILNSEQQNENTIKFMASQLSMLIKEIPQNDFHRLDQLRKIHSENKDKHIAHQTNIESDESEEGQEQIEKEEEGEEKIENEEQMRELQEKRKAEEDLQNDGWNIVRKKK